MFRDPRQARALFARLDVDHDGQVKLDEVPEPFQGQFEGFLRRGDRDRDGQLTEREFVAGAERLSRFLSRPQ
jgi:hypothetical protein